jgi:hypothetical protein
VIALVWHVFLVVWGTGAVVGVVIVYRGSETQRLTRSVHNQALRTRQAELQARERRALES